MKVIFCLPKPNFSSAKFFHVWSCTSKSEGFDAAPFPAQAHTRTPLFFKPRQGMGGMAWHGMAWHGMTWYGVFAAYHHCHHFGSPFIHLGTQRLQQNWYTHVSWPRKGKCCPSNCISLISFGERGNFSWHWGSVHVEKNLDVAPFSTLTHPRPVGQPRAIVAPFGYIPGGTEA